MSPFYSIFLERIIVNAFSTARLKKKDKYIDFASDLYHYGREFVINNREPDYKLSDIEKIEKEYQNLDIKETKQKIDYLPAEFEGQEPSQKKFYYKYGKYDSNGKFIEKPTNREYFNNLVEKHEKEFSKFQTSSIIIKEVTENDENENIIIYDDNEINEVSFENIFNSKIIDTHIYDLRNYSYELVKGACLNDELYQMCLYWTLRGFELHELDEFLFYQLEHSFYGDKPTMNDYLEKTILKLDERFGFLKKSTKKIVYKWFDKSTPEALTYKTKAEKNDSNRIKESAFKKKSLYIVFFDALIKTNILSDKTSKASIARVLKNSWGLSPKQIQDKWNYEIDKLVKEPLKSKTKKEIDEIINALKEIEIYLKDKYEINN